MCDVTMPDVALSNFGLMVYLWSCFVLLGLFIWAFFLGR